MALKKQPYAKLDAIIDRNISINLVSSNPIKNVFIFINHTDNGQFAIKYFIDYCHEKVFILQANSKNTVRATNLSKLTLLTLKHS